MGRGLGGSHHQQLGPGVGSQQLVDKQLFPAGEDTQWQGEGRPCLLEEVAGDRADAGVGTAALGMEVGFP